MTPPKTKQTPSLEPDDPQVRRRNERLKQELVDSRDHTKQSGRGKGDNKLVKPAKPPGKSGD